MARASTTVNPLHFEDLEPHRFEDLVRQLIYDFREWHSLEATGRLGADEGVDIRAVERIPSEPLAYDDTDEPDEDRPGYEHREWRIQCKRERRMGPQKLSAVVYELLPADEKAPHGAIVAAACDFSKKSRDLFRAAMVRAGVEESFLWGKAELEDMLFRPQNDHLLWAYFGISIRIRRTAHRTTVGRRLTTKRKLVKSLGDIGGPPQVQAVLIRDPEAEEYPWPEDPSTFLRAPKWRYYDFKGFLAPDHAIFVTRRMFGWLKTDEGTWDSIDRIDTSYPRYPELTAIPYPGSPDEELARRFWEVRVPKEEKAFVEELSAIHFDQIIAVDDIGDIHHEPPHLVVDFEGRTTPFRVARTFIEHSRTFGSDSFPLENVDRKNWFPQPLPEIEAQEWNAHWERG